VSDDFATIVERHWYSDVAGSLLERIDAALAESGVDPNRLTADDLLAVDEFHIRGREATEELAALAAVTPDEHVLDVGCGLGGPSRYLASRCGCRVTGIDLTAEYCQVASVLADRIGLADVVRYQQGDALALAFDDAHFDVAWTQHISMNIPDKRRLFEEMYRVIKPGGRIAVYDPIAGDGAPLEFPVPWSCDGAISFLIDADETRATLQSVGFAIEAWRDVSREALDWFARNAATASDTPPALNLHLLVGPEWPAMVANMVKNLAAGRLAVIQAVARR
jgi:SAM-dependent methyltransferase